MLAVYPPHSPTCPTCTRTRPRSDFFIVLTAVAGLALSGCSRPAAPNAIVGAWYVTMPAAPYPYHLFLFHADGTVVQSNPDSGDPNHSDSNLMGAWKNEGDSVTAKLIETSADRTTHQFVVRTELSISLQVQSNKFAGTGTAFHFDATGKPDRTPHSVAFHGDRILP